MDNKKKAPCQICGGSGAHTGTVGHPYTPPSDRCYVINKKLGERILFSGGGEDTPRVVVERYYQPLGLHHGEKHFAIEQNGQIVFLSPKTMQAILEWGEKE